jgi:hypothetical protein
MQRGAPTPPPGVAGGVWEARLKTSYARMGLGSAAERKQIMWIAFKNVETGTVHAVSLPAGMSPHGFAMAWPLEETKEPLTCHLCLRFASRWRKQDSGLEALLPGAAGGRGNQERRCLLCGVPVSQCCC